MITSGYYGSAQSSPEKNVTTPQKGDSMTVPSSWLNNSPKIRPARMIPIPARNFCQKDHRASV
jgi:hypothetical protein